MSFVVHRVAKHAARYTDAGGREKCGMCRFFVAPRACGKVIGPVSPQGWCKYFSRQMVSQFGGGISAGGGPTLLLDFMTPGTLDPRITFTRASTGTYFDSTGVMQTAAIMAPRWNYDPVSLQLKGLLLEDQRTNLWLQSSDLSNAATGIGTIGVSALIRTGNSSAAPDGTTTGTRLAYNAVPSAGNSSVIQQSFTMTAAVYTFSVWLRGNVGGEVVYLCTTPNGTLYYRQSCTLTTQWQRFTLTTGALTAVGWFWEIGTDLRDASQTAKSAQTIYAWGAQVELGDFPTSYIPTTTVGVTRAIDSCVISPANMSWFTPPGGSWFAEFDCFNPAPINGCVVGQAGAVASGGICPIYLNNLLRFNQYDGANSMGTTVATSPNTIARGVTTWDVGQTKATMNAAAIRTSVLLTTGYGAMATTGVAVMTITTQGTMVRLSGHIRALKYWPRVLSDSEMQAVTT